MLNIRSLIVVALLSPCIPVAAQQGGAQPAASASNAFDFWLATQYLDELRTSHTFLWTVDLTMDHHSGLHALASDCEMHLASPGPTDKTRSFPAAIVVEPPNMCKIGPAGDQPSAWAAVADDHMIGKKCTVSGFPRIFTEHATGGTPGSSNPNHSLEIHPALKIACEGEAPFDFRTSLSYIDGMRAIKPTTASTCLQGRKLEVKSQARGGKAGYVFKETGGGSCGNFLKVFVTVNPDTVFLRSVGGPDGGHTLLVRATTSLGEEDPDPGSGLVTLKLYTYNGTDIDQRLTNAAHQTEPTSLTVHGVLTYDYWSIVKKLTASSSTAGFRAVANWEPVDFPLALVLFGEVPSGDQ
jgi:hypothetical protein